MKAIIAFFLLIVAPLAFAGDPATYPEAQPGDELYRKDRPGRVIAWPWFGGVTRVGLPKPKTVEEMREALEVEGYRLELQDRRELAESGRDRLLLWLPFVFLSMAATFFLKSYGLQFVGVAGFVLSISYVLSGIVEIKLAEQYGVSTWLLFGLAIASVVAFAVSAFALRDKGYGKPGKIAEWIRDKLKKD